MPRKPKVPEEVQIEEVSEDQETGTPNEYVTQEEYDRAVKHLQNEISQIREDLEQRVSDLENLVGQPEGGVQFFTPTVNQLGDDEAESVQDYLPLDEGDQGDVPWYQPLR